MKIETYFFGIQLIPENKEDKEIIKKLLNSEITYSYEEGNVYMDDENLIIER